MTAQSGSGAQTSRPVTGRRAAVRASATGAPIRPLAAARRINTSAAGRRINTSAAARRINTSAAGRRINTSAAGRRIDALVAVPPIKGVPARSSWPRSQRGSASLIGLALCAFVVIAALVTADIGALAVARARAETAADLAALAAVTPRLAPPGPSAPDEPSGLGSPAERAHLVAASNGADVIACSCNPLDSTITVRVQARLVPFGATVAVRGYARAVLPMDAMPAASVNERASPSDDCWLVADRGPCPARRAS